MDADLSHDPMEIPKMIDILDKSSFVIGSRYIKGGKCEMPGHRFILSVMKQIYKENIEIKLQRIYYFI